MDKQNLRTETIGNLVIETYHISDYDTDPRDQMDPNNYKGIDADERAKYEAQDADRIRAYERGDWCYIGVCVDVRIKTETRWAVPHLVGRSSVFSVESDSGDDYIAETEREMRADALADLERTRHALCSMPALPA